MTHVRELWLVEVPALNNVIVLIPKIIMITIIMITTIMNSINTKILWAFVKF